MIKATIQLHYDKEKLETFFAEVAKLTINHDDFGDRAVVYPCHLGAALERVDPNWWRYFGSDEVSVEADKDE